MTAKGGTIISNYGRCTLRYPTITIVVSMAVLAASMLNVGTAAASTPIGPVDSTQSDDEFVGPFLSWANLQRDYGAKGDGQSDDTQALQSALNDLGSKDHPPVLYLPAGTYVVTKPLTLRGKIYVSVIGEHPNSTILKWMGRAAGIMLHIDGVAYSRFDRLTFDGNSKASVAVDQSKSDGKRPNFDTGNEYADDVFTDAVTGLRGGYYGYGFAETSVLRCKFLRLRDAGIHLGNFNALDLFVWYSDFEDNNVGISNEPGAGGFSAYNNLFQRSRGADIKTRNSEYFNFRDNFSIGSNMFIDQEFGGANGSPTLLQNNAVAVKRNNSCNGCVVRMGDMGPLFMMRNVFVTPADARGPAVLQKSMRAPDCVSVANSFTVNNPVSCRDSKGAPGRYLSFDNRTISPGAVALSPPALPHVLPSYSRPIFEAKPGGSGPLIQQTINQAAVDCGNRPVVHLHYGTYNVQNTLVIPANCDMQIVGDGGTTKLVWTGAGNGPLLLLQGPSKAILRDFLIDMKGRAEGIVVTNADQVGSRVYLQEVQLTGSSQANLFVDGLDYTRVEAHDFYDSSTAAGGKTGIGVKVVGGQQAASGKPRGGKTLIFAGAASGNSVSYELSRGAKVISRDRWYEGGNRSTYAVISGGSELAVEGSRIALPKDNGPAILLRAFSGKAEIAQSLLDNAVALGPNATGDVLVLGNLFYGTDYYVNRSPTALLAFLGNRHYDSRDGSLAIPNLKPSPDTDAIRAMLGFSIEHPSSITSLGQGVTDVRMYRVYVESGTVGLHLMQ